MPCSSSTDLNDPPRALDWLALKNRDALAAWRERWQRTGGSAPRQRPPPPGAPRPR